MDFGTNKVNLNHNDSQLSFSSNEQLFSDSDFNFDLQENETEIKQHWEHLQGAFKKQFMTIKSQKQKIEKMAQNFKNEKKAFYHEVKQIR